MRKRILLVAGTRPECIKLAPVYLALKQQDFADVVMLGTGQHSTLAEQALKVFGIDFDEQLDLVSHDQPLGRLAGRLFEQIDRAVERIAPDLVLVQGDTSSAMVGSVVAFYRRIAVGHVEAGLRTHDLDNPFPEEFNRRVSGILAALHFAPTAKARANLVAEGVASDRILVTGNTVIDALLSIVDTVGDCGFPKEPGRRLILVTLHRRESFGSTLVEICGAIRALRDQFDDVEFAYPVHPNPNVDSTVRRELGQCERIHLLPPLDYKDIVALMKASYLILTDSGGLQEEAPALGKPVLVVRMTTERPEAVDAGVARLVGVRQSDIVREAAAVLNSKARYAEMAKGHSPFGDGHASGRIAAACQRFLQGQ